MGARKTRVPRGVGCVYVYPEWGVWPQVTSCRGIGRARRAGYRCQAGGLVEGCVCGGGGGGGACTSSWEAPTQLAPTHAGGAGERACEENQARPGRRAWVAQARRHLGGCVVGRALGGGPVLARPEAARALSGVESRRTLLAGGGQALPCYAAGAVRRWSRPLDSFGGTHDCCGAARRSARAWRGTARPLLPAPLLPPPAQHPPPAPTQEQEG